MSTPTDPDSKLLQEQPPRLAQTYMPHDAAGPLDKSGEAAEMVQGRE